MTTPALDPNLVLFQHVEERWMRLLDASALRVERGVDWVLLDLPAQEDEGSWYGARILRKGDSCCGFVLCAGQRLEVEQVDTIELTLQVEKAPDGWSGLKVVAVPAGRIGTHVELLLAIRDFGRLFGEGARTTDASAPTWTLEDTAGLMVEQLRGRARGLFTNTSGPDGASIEWRCRGEVRRWPVTQAGGPAIAHALAINVLASLPVPDPSQRTVPLVRPASAQASSALGGPLAGGVVVIVAEESDTGFHWKARGDADLAYNRAAIDEAVDNLGHQVGWIRLAGASPLTMVMCGGNHEPSLLLDRGTLDALHARIGPVLIARIVSNDLVYVTAPDDAEGVARVEGIATKSPDNGPPSG